MIVENLDALMRSLEIATEEPEGKAESLRAAASAGAGPARAVSR